MLATFIVARARRIAASSFTTPTRMQVSPRGRTTSMRARTALCTATTGRVATGRATVEVACKQSTSRNQSCNPTGNAQQRRTAYPELQLDANFRACSNARMLATLERMRLGQTGHVARFDAKKKCSCFYAIPPSFAVDMAAGPEFEIDEAREAIATWCLRWISRRSIVSEALNFWA
jgi:hypothetical protein